LIEAETPGHYYKCWYPVNAEGLTPVAPETVGVAL
jgi:hypothetical protein